jgi:hypothetical protein
MNRFLILLPVLAICMVLPTGAAPDLRGQCLNHCNVQYQLCLRSATTKAARKSCATGRKPCKQGCVVPTFPTGKLK